MFLLLLIYNLTTSAALLWMMAKNPRFMLQDYPQEIIAMVPPQTDQEKKGARIHGLPFLLMLFVFPLIVGFVLRFSHNMSFLQVFLYILELLFSFNLVDLLILDWLIFCKINPKFMVIPGTDGNPAYKDYRYHFIAFLKGTVFSILGALLFAGVVEAIYTLI